jgi:hypothetical protein
LQPGGRYGGKLLDGRFVDGGFVAETGEHDLGAVGHGMFSDVN